MKIKNDLISLKIGKKQYEFNNLILNSYLEKFVSSQLNKDNIQLVAQSKKLIYCLLKFDTPFKNLNESSILHNNDFDICFVFGVHIREQQTISENQIVVDYNYCTSKNDNVWDYSKGTATDNHFSQYNDRQITAIGFNTSWSDNDYYPVCAVLDTSNYNIYTKENEELSITRRDIITTDALFYSNNKEKVPGPAHLIPYGLPQIINQPNIYNEDGGSIGFYNNAYGILYSVGLSSYIDYIDKEFIVGEDIQIQQNENEIIIQNLENYLKRGSLLYPSPNLYPSSNVYPVQNNYKYIIFKYKVWQMVHAGTYDNITEEIKDTGYYYYQAIPIDKFGNSNVKIKYERG